MNLCKSNLISSRTKSLREKFSRNRSYSELSFKDTTTSSLVSTPTESCAGTPVHTASAIAIGNSGAFGTKKHHHHHHHSQQHESAALVTDTFYNPWGSGINLNTNTNDELFRWRCDVAIQCELVSAPGLVPLAELGGKKQTAKKKISSSSTTSAASTLINAAAATLRMTGITSGGGDSSGSGSSSGHRFWKSSHLLPDLSVSPVVEQTVGDGCLMGATSTDHLHLRRQKSSRWASTTKRPALKRAASFDSRRGYRRLVQSISSPNSPPDLIEVGDTAVDHYDEPPKSALPILTTNTTTTSVFDQHLQYGSEHVVRPNRLATDLYSYQHSHSATHLGEAHTANVASGSGGFFWNSHSLTNTFRPTALLGASAAMAAAAPFTLVAAPSGTNRHKVDSPSSVSQISATNPQHQSFDQSLVGGGGGGNSRTSRKHSSNEISLKELRRKQFLTSRKQPSSAPDSFDDDLPFSPREKGPTTNASTSSGENELFNFNTVHRLLNISLSASNTDSIVKPFLLELPDSNTCHPNLPSPNIQSEIQEVNPVLRKLSVLSRAPHKALASRLSDSGTDKSKARSYLDFDDDFFDDLEDEEETLSEEPPVAALQRRRRRRALVPPKLITDGYESCTEFDLDGKHSSRSNKSTAITPEPSDINLAKVIGGGGDGETEGLVDVGDGTSLQVPSVDSKSVGSSESGQSAEHKHLMPNVTVESILIEDMDDLSLGGGRVRPMSEMTVNNGDGHGKSQTLGSPKSPRKSHPSTSGSSGSGGSGGSGSVHHLGVNHGSSRGRRRSSVVVIPPMQICPGDLLVYSKVLSQRSNMIDNLEGTFSSALLNEQEHSRKHKNTWSLLRLFDRSNSRKAAADQILCGLEEVLATMPPTNSFVDETMVRYRGISWNEFLAQQEDRRFSNASSFSAATSSLVTSASAAAAAAATATVGIGCSRFFHGARFSSLQSNALDSSGGGGNGNGGSNSVAAAVVSSTAVSVSHVCKKISLPAGGGITRAMQQNLERNLRPADRATSLNKTDEQPFPDFMINVTGSSSSASPKPRLQRTESCSTVSDVESINEQSGVSPTRKVDGLLGMKGHSSLEANATEEETGGDRYDSESFCCSCLPITKREQRRREALWELFQSDLFFLTEHLMVLKNVFMEPLKKIQVEGYAMFAEPEMLFGNLDELCMVTFAFCREFLNILVSQTSGVGDVQVVAILAKLFLQSGRAAALTAAYHRYTISYINALNYLEKCRLHVEFTEFEKWCNRDTRCKKLQLTDLLVSPVQHVMRVPLLLKEIETRTLEPSEKSTIQSIIHEQESSLRLLDDKMKWLKNFERLLDIQRNSIWPSVIDMEPKVFVPEFLKSLLQKQPCEKIIVSSKRQIVLEGPLMVLDSGKPVEMYVFLFDDMLLITRRKKGLGKKQSTLTERFVSNCSGRNSSFSSVVSVAGGSGGNVVGAGVGSNSTPASVNSAVNNAASATAGATGGSSASLGGGDPIAGGGPTGALFKYVVYKQPLCLDRFYLHDVLPSTENAANLKNAFVVVCLNRFQQITTLHTFQAASESAKNTWVSKLRETTEQYKRNLQNLGQAFRNGRKDKPGGKDGEGGKAGGTSGATSAQEKASSSSAFGHRLNLNNFQMYNTGSSYRKNKSPPRGGATGRQYERGSADTRLSSGSVSMASSLRDNVSASFFFDDSIVTTSTFT